MAAVIRTGANRSLDPSTLIASSPGPARRRAGVVSLTEIGQGPSWRSGPIRCCGIQPRAHPRALLEAFTAKASPGLQAGLKAIQKELQQGTVLGQFRIRIVK